MRRVKVMPRKAGRPPKDKGSKRTAHLSVRISAMLRGQLEAARHHDEIERSLSDEVAMRLSESFTADQHIEKRFGGADTALLLQILAEKIRAIEVGAGGEHHWLDHRFVFDQVRTMIKILLDRLAPPGRPGAMPEVVRAWHPTLRKHARDLGRWHAQNALSLLDAAGKEGVPHELPPGLYFRAAVLLGPRLRRAAGRRGKGSASTA
jgi:hypothetical protein